jgi:Zinc finger C-x8-C-x5-C-x3-H type (and similar)
MPRPICRFFNSARGCRNGDACKFQHVLAKENDLKRLSSEGGLADAAPCRNFAEKGWCPYGERCWYSHKPLVQPKVKLKHQAAGQAPVVTQGALQPKVAEPPSPEQQRADQVKEEGNVLYRAGNYEEAVSRYTSTLGSQIHLLERDKIFIPFFPKSTIRSPPIIPTAQQHTFRKRSSHSLLQTVRRRERSKPPNRTLKPSCATRVVSLRSERALLHSEHFKQRGKFSQA